LVSQQLEATNMDAGNHRDWCAAIHRNNERRREVQAEIDAAVGNRVGLADADRRGDIADIGEAFLSQQLLRDILRSDADTGDLR
jgi:hypothetical protein